MMNRTTDTGPSGGRSDSFGQQLEGTSGLTSIAALLGSLASPDRVQAQQLPSGGSDIQRFLAQHRQQQQPMPPPPLPDILSLSNFLLQQQQLQQGRLQLGDSSSGSGSSFDAPQFIKQQEEQHLANLMLLQQRQSQSYLLQPFIAEQLRSGSGLAAASQLLLGATQPQTILTDAKQLQQRAAEDAHVMNRMNAVAATEFSDKSRSDSKKEDVAKTEDSKPEPDSQVAEESEEDKDDEIGDIDYRAETFPFKLFRMLDEATKNGNDDVVSFLPSGRAFAIHKPREFITEMMPKYFTTSRMSSFQRQLNLYGFRRITEGNDKGGYFHQHFQKGRRGLCRKIKRKKKTAKAPRNFFLDSQPRVQLGGPSVSVRQLIADGHMRNGLLPEGQHLTQSGFDLQRALAAAQLAEQQRRQQQELLLRQLLMRDRQEQTRVDENKSRGLE